MTDILPIRPHGAPDADFDAQHEASMVYFSTEREPSFGDWGICLGGDATAQMGGQQMTFNWFGCKDDLLGAMRAYLIFSHLPPQGYNLAAAQERVADAISAFEVHEDTERLADDLRNSLRSHVRIDWIGPIEELMTGTNSFARQLRAEFFDQEEDTEVPSVLAGTEDEFRDFLSSWLSGG